MWLGLRVHRPEMLLSASRRTQPLEMLGCVVGGWQVGGVEGSVRRSLGSRGQEVGDKSLGAQGSQAPGSCFQGGGLNEEKEAGHEVSGQTLEPPKVRLPRKHWVTTQGTHIPSPIHVLSPGRPPGRGSPESSGQGGEDPSCSWPGTWAGKPHPHPGDHTLAMPRPALLS